MLKFNRNSWHYQLAEFGTTSSQSVPQNLCPYVRRMIKGVIIGLFTLFMASFLAFVAVLGPIGSAIGWAFAGFPAVNPEGGMFDNLVVIFIIEMVLLFLAMIGFAMKMGLQALKDISRERRMANLEYELNNPQPPKEPNVVWEWIKAKHDKICPSIEFE